MAEDAAFQKRVQRIGELVAQLETAADPNSRALAKDLVESLMALHGGALERMLEIASKAGESGESIIRKCGGDELVGSVLLLYGLHPEDMRTRVIRAIEKSHDFLSMHSAKAKLVSIHEDGTVTVRLELGSSGGCGSSAALVKSTLEVALQNAAPDATTVVVEEAGALLTQSGFVSVAQLRASGPAVASYAAQAEQSRD
jgi:Fe-S cluster biogenesis protein NfuA